MPVSLLLQRLFLLFAVLVPTVQAAEQPVSIAGSRYSIPGILELPDAGDDPAPAALLLHGSASQKNEVGDLYRHLALALKRAGVASLRIDFAGTGDSRVSYRSYSLSSATSDALRALAYLRRQPGVAAESIVIVGFSEGGLIAQRVALAGEGVAALATWSTVATDGTGSFRRSFDEHHETARRDGYVAFSFPWLSEPLEFDLRWFREMREQKTLTAMRAFDKPILAIAGAADKVVPHTHSLALVAQSPHLRSRAVVLAGANHIFNVLDESSGSGLSGSSRQLLDETVRWISEVLTPGPRE